MMNYFTRFRDDILQHTINSKKIIAKPACLGELTVRHFLSFMGTRDGTRGYANEIRIMSEERTAESKKGYENGIRAMRAARKKDMIMGLERCRPRRGASSGIIMFSFGMINSPVWSCGGTAILGRSQLEGVRDEVSISPQP